MNDLMFAPISAVCTFSGSRMIRFWRIRMIRGNPGAPD